MIGEGGGSQAGRREMKLPVSLFLALRYLRPRRTFISAVTVISVLGVTLGVAVLVVVLSVMSGFDDMWREKILGFNAHVMVTGSRGVIYDIDRLIAEVERVEGVKAAAPFVQGLVFLQHNDSVYTPMLRGVDPCRESRVSQIPRSIIAGHFDVTGTALVVGADLARELRLRVGSRVLVYSPAGFISEEEIRLPEEMIVRGIFEVGMWDFDMGYVLSSLEAARDLYGLEEGVHGLQVMTADPFQAAEVAQNIAQTIGPGYRVMTWMQLNRQLFAALRVEKNMMFFLLIFITVVAAFGITNTLITLAVQKTREIGLMKALGFPSGTIMRIFLWQGWISGVIGTGLGLALGLMALDYRNEILRFLSARLGLDLFPKELYRLSEIPARTSLEDLVTVIVAVLVICTLAGVIPAYRAARQDPARALRYE
ncbi:MAG: ABC transporter permease [Verrucomicrobia bacterium]|nr:MAG: ABC transporter permease [Verrucomicrobiota bacterium]